MPGFGFSASLAGDAGSSDGGENGGAAYFF